ncbi:MULTISPECIES: head decoration protein [Marinobacter]|uniref:head decoration protein n=1 Tax=Marinobacter TaxID=2742 RepID=UPI0024202389|nr:MULTISPECIES: head decoration protein [Marinobacter]|tara:strand:- start:1546 stop:1881 length:336 start_codon:yes stop_codon:yes gene_type:complete
MKTETTRAGEFLVSEANGKRSRETITVTGGPYVAGQVLGKITASGKYTAYASGASNGTQTAAGVLYAAADGSSADVTAVGVVRDAEIDEALLTGDDADAITDLAAIGIIAR